MMMKAGFVPSLNDSVHGGSCYSRMLAASKMEKALAGAPKAKRRKVTGVVAVDLDKAGPLDKDEKDIYAS